MEWISVEERLPNRTSLYQERVWCLVALKSGCVKSLAYEFGGDGVDRLFEAGWHATGSPVTHWMPLPPPPEQ